MDCLHNYDVQSTLGGALRRYPALKNDRKHGSKVEHAKGGSLGTVSMIERC